ncbi:histone acetylation protein-domain-containing protein [Dichotomocladium elegans]|nr:histone acetylation protein-domain-containing protein [Dichotomocladium elegans]
MANRPEPFKLYGNSGSKNETDAQHTKRLVLVSLTPQGDSTMRQIVCGMEADEFVLDATRQRIVYIAKVDTSGAFPDIRGMTARLLQAYLRAMAPCTVHVFARSQPQYLFRNSKKHPDKHILSARDLIRWWRKVISQSVSQSDVAQDQKQAPGGFGWWWIPGVEDMSSALRETGDNSSSSTRGWTYGQPYEPAARARDVIPQFQDDTKARVLKSAAEDGNDAMTVQELQELLPFTEECGSNHQVGFFVAHIPTKASGRDAACEEETEQEENCVRQSVFTLLWNTLMELHFHNKAEVIQGTRAFVAAWDQQKLSRPLEIATCGSASAEDKLLQRTATAPSSASSSIVVNTLSVKRRTVRPANVQPLSSNTLSVKRAAVDTMAAVNSVPVKRIRGEDGK